MKKILVLLSFFCSYQLAAQECSEYFKLSKGVKIEMVSYDKKDKPTATVKTEVVDMKPVNGGILLVLDSQTFDTKGRLLAKGQASGTCNKGDYVTDIRNISSDMIPKSADIKLNIDGDKMVYPAGMKVGDKLPDAAINITSTLASGMNLININATISNRKVESMETVETPAGKFECLKITYVMDAKMKLLGDRKLVCSEYLAKGVGVVKQDQFDEKGKKQSSMLLTKLEK